MERKELLLPLGIILWVGASASAGPTIVLDQVGSTTLSGATLVTIETNFEVQLIPSIAPEFVSAAHWSALTSPPQVAPGSQGVDLLAAASDFSIATYAGSGEMQLALYSLWVAPESLLPAGQLYEIFVPGQASLTVAAWPTEDDGQGHVVALPQILWQLPVVHGFCQEDDRVPVPAVFPLVVTGLCFVRPLRRRAGL
jgi:hypothetical protein